MARRDGTRAQRTLIWLVILVAFVAYLIWALQSEEIFRVVSKKLEHTEAGVVVSGEIQNTAAAAEAVNVEVTFFDSNGRQLSQEVVKLNNLATGVPVPFRTQPQKFADVNDYTIHVNTGKNMYGN